jgi:hypothetical protein
MPEQQKTVFWIASYPKSGNTWLRFLACNLVFGPVDSASLLNRLAPDIHELGPAPEPPRQPVFLKTHFLHSPLLPLGKHSAAAIYVVRDPADVMLSNYHYAMRRGAVSADDGDGLSRYVDRYIAAHGDPRWVELGIGSWQDNVCSWRQAGKDFPVLWVRYEDMLADATVVATSLCKHLGLERSPDEIARAVAGTTFERMRAIEEADIAARRVGIFYKPHLQDRIGAGLRFMRSGQTGEAKRRLPEEQWRRFNDVFGDLRQQLGYD